MPYAEKIIGIYKIVNKATGKAYVGQSQNVKKRIAEHFRQLRLQQHPNPKLQNAFNKYGEDAFEWSVEVECADVNDLDAIEEAFLNQDACFEQPISYNIASFAKAPMRGKAHSEDSRRRISEGRRASNFDFKSDAYRKTLSEAQRRRVFSDKKFVAKVKFIIDNPDMTYAERARRTGTDTSTARKLALRYAHLQGAL